MAPPLPTLMDRIDAQMFVQKFGAAIFGSLGTLAILLTMLGSYVLAKSMAVMRRREMGIRAALGATRRQLAAIVLAETGRLVAAGVTIGLALVWIGAATIRSFLFHVRPARSSDAHRRGRFDPGACGRRQPASGDAGRKGGPRRASQGSVSAHDGASSGRMRNGGAWLALEPFHYAKVTARRYASTT